MSICGWKRQAEQQTHRAQPHHRELRPVGPTGVSARKGSGSSYPPPSQYGEHHYHPQVLRRWINAVNYLSE